MGGRKEGLPDGGALRRFDLLLAHCIVSALGHAEQCASKAVRAPAPWQRQIARECVGVDPVCVDVELR